MRRISILATILITSFVMALAGLVASPIATASENETARVSSRFAFGSPLLTKTQKAAIKEAVTTSGTDATFVVTAEAGKLPGVSDSEVQLLATKRGQVIKSYLVKLGVNKSSVTIKVKITRLGIVPKTKIVGSYAAPVATTATVVAAPALTCATGGTCKVGDAGPGGGLVYYVHRGNFACGPTLAANCNILEVAPGGWSGVAADPAKLWAVTANQTADVVPIPPLDGIANDSAAYNNALAIGLGYKNSDLIVAQGNDTTTAAGVARAYTGGSKTDWYLPTTAELNLLCQWNHRVTQNVTTVCIGSTATLNTGIGASGSGFVSSVDYYWSSSENLANYAWSQQFDFGSQSTSLKNYTWYVRPVRAFAALTCATGGTCIVGDRGPGGGIVYYVDNVGFSCGPTLAATCKHLEVAPIGWTGVGTEFYFPYWPYLVWATGTGVPTPSGNVILDITDITNDASPYNNASGIGLGYKNSVAIVTQGNDTTTAAGAARAYAGGSKNDWYLPTAAELNLLCQWNHDVTQNVSTLCIASGATLNTGTGATGSGLGGDSYWSSSETGSGNAWLQDFYGGAQDSRGKSRDNVVRPIRAF